MGYPTGSALIHPTRILDRIGITSGHRVLDVGCGSLGHFVFPLAERVGASGRVYAVDIQRRALSHIDRTAKDEQLFNIETVWGDADRVRGIRLDDGIADATIIVSTLSSSARPLDFVKEVSRLTRPSGVIVVADWEHAQAPIGPPIERRVASDSVREWFENDDILLEDTFQAGPYHYGLIFRRT